MARPYTFCVRGGEREGRTGEVIQTIPAYKSWLEKRLPSLSKKIKHSFSKSVTTSSVVTGIPKINKLYNLKKHIFEDITKKFSQPFIQN